MQQRSGLYCLQKKTRTIDVRALWSGLLLAMYRRTCAALCPRLAVRLPHDEVGDFAAKRLTYQVYVLQLHPLREFVVQLIDGRWANTCHPSEIRLRPPPPSRVDSKILIIAKLLYVRF